MSPRIIPAEAPFFPFAAEQFAKLMPPGVQPLTLFRTLALDERLFRRFMGGGLLDKGHLTLRQREIVIDRITALSGCEYEWGVHVAFFANSVGLTSDQIHALVHGGAGDPCWTQHDERALLRLCDQLHADCTLDAAAWADGRAHFSEIAMMEILMLAGFYRTVSYICNALDLPLEPFGARFPA